MLVRIDVTVETLTPLHIGTGLKLVRDFDYVTHGGRTFRLQEDRLAEELFDRDPHLTKQLLRTPPGQLVRPGDLRDGSPLVRYVLPGEPKGNEFREAIKDAHDRPYLPGSSLKGALRTVLAWRGWREVRPGLKGTLGEWEAKFAARPVEKVLFGPDPNRDLLRAVRVSDSAPVGRDALVIQVVRVWTRRGPGAPISVEAVKPGVGFSLEVSVDERLFSTWGRRVDGFPLPHRDWVGELLKLGTERATERLRREQALWEEWGRSAGGPPSPYHALLQDLIARKKKAGPRGFPLQLGFGTGWEGTTIGAPLKDDPDWKEVWRKFGLGRVPGRRGAQTAADDFPSSRRVAVLDERTGQISPLGWVWVEWREGG